MSAIIPPAFFAGSPGPMELIVIFLLILILFGPRRLPEIAKMIGKTIHELRRASEDFKDQIMSIESDPAEDSDITIEPDANQGIDQTDQSDPSDYDEYADQIAEDGIIDEVDVVEDSTAEEDIKGQSA